MAMDGINSGMSGGGLGRLPGGGNLGGLPTPGQNPGEGGQGFGQMLGDMVVNRPTQTHKYADRMAVEFAAGGNVDPHQLAIASAKASVEIQLATRTISQAVSGVRTLMTTQI